MQENKESKIRESQAELNLKNLQAKEPNIKSPRVDDNEKLFDNEFLKKIERISINSRIIIPDGATGNRKSKSKGSSVEFSDYREYAEADDFRRIDWNAYGRFERLFIKLFMEEREAMVHIFLDTSKSMDFGNPKKSFASRRLAAAIGYLCFANYDSVSVYCINENIDAMRLNLRGKNNFPALLKTLESVEYRGETNLYSSVLQANIQDRRGISIIISDLFSNNARSRNSGYFDDMLKYLKFKKQDVYVCQVLSPAEIEPDLDENCRLVDSETSEFLDVTISSSLIRTYKDAFRRFVERIENDCFKRGARYMLMNTSVPVEQAVKTMASG